MSLAPRSYLFVPGQREELHDKALRSGADAVVLDLEDAVPARDREDARLLVARTARRAAVWVRVNPARSIDAEHDLASVGELAAGVRAAKVDDPEDAAWIVARVRPGTDVLCAIESARAVRAAADIAAVPGVSGLSLGGLDLARDLRVPPDSPTLDAVRMELVIASAAGGIRPPVDSVHPGLDDESGLRDAARRARRLGFGGKSAIHPRQLEPINRIFAPSPEELEWADRVVAAWQASDGRPTTTELGEFVDPPVVERARQIRERD